MVGGNIGRKGKYQEWLQPDKLFLIENWKKSGLTDKQICEKIGVNVSTLYDWEKKYSEFSEALKKGKEFSDFEVENALFKNATGYFQKVTKVHKLKTIKVIDGRRLEEEKLVEKDENIYIQPQTAAQIFWLKNRKSSTWRNNPTNDENEQSIEILSQILEQTKLNAKKE